MKHLINVEVLSVNGITVCDKDMRSDDFTSIQISCVVGIRRKKEFKKTCPSLPIRKTKATWSKTKDRTAKSPMLSIETSLNNKRKKTFEVSILLDRGNEQMLIGIASLVFVSALLETEIEIPINPLGSKRAMEIMNEAKTLNNRGSESEENVNESFFRINPLLNDDDAAQTLSFNGSDSGRIYSVQKSASIRLKCACLPKQYKDVFMHFDEMLQTHNGVGAEFTTLGSSSPSPVSFNLSSHFQAKQNLPPEQYIQPAQLDDTSAQRHGFFGTDVNFLSDATGDQYPHTQYSHYNHARESRMDQHYHSSPHDYPHASAQGGNLLVPCHEELSMLYDDLRSKLTQINKDSMTLLGKKASDIANSRIGLSLRNLLIETTNQFLSINRLGIRGFDPYVPNHELLLDIERSQPCHLATSNKEHNDPKLIQVNAIDILAKVNSTKPPPVDGYTTFAEYLERRITEKIGDSVLHEASREFSEDFEIINQVSNEPSILTDPFPSIDASLSRNETKDCDMHDEGNYPFQPIDTTTKNYAYVYETRDYGPTKRAVSGDTVSGTLEGGIRLSETVSDLSDILGPLDDQDQHFYDQSFYDEDDLDGSYQDDSMKSVPSMESTFTRSSF